MNIFSKAPWPSFGPDEKNAVEAVLDSGKVSYWTGDQGRLFEEEYAAFCGCKHAVALANGTVALELALRVLGVGPGDEVIVPCRTFIATASCVAVCGARPVMADVEPTSQNLTAKTIAAVVTSRTKAIIAVHLAGWPCDMDPIMALAKEQGLAVIEDCAQAHGARYKGRPVGSFGDVAAFSFCQDKIMTTGGEGGMFVTNDSQLWERAWAYKDHGKSYDAVYRRMHPPGYGFRWLHESFGTNWRITEMQSALGRVALKKLPGWVEKRSANAARLTNAFCGIEGLRLPLPADEFFHSYYKYYAFVRPEYLAPGWDRDRIMAEINAAGIPCFSGSCSEIYLEKAFDQEGLRPPERLPVAKQLGESSLMFLVHPTLDTVSIDAMAEAACVVFKQAFHVSCPL
jgi:hypothetical protein